MSSAKTPQKPKKSMNPSADFKYYIPVNINDKKQVKALLHNPEVTWDKEKTWEWNVLYNFEKYLFVCFLRSESFFYIDRTNPDHIKTVQSLYTTVEACFVTIEKQGTKITSKQDAFENEKYCDQIVKIMGLATELMRKAKVSPSIRGKSFLYDIFSNAIAKADDYKNSLVDHLNVNNKTLCESNESLTEQLKEKEKVVEQQKGRLISLYATTNSQNTQIESLSKTNDQQSSAIQSLETTVAQQKSEINSLTKKVTELNQSKGSLEKRIREAEQTIEDLQTLSESDSQEQLRRFRGKNEEVNSLKETVEQKEKTISDLTTRISDELEPEIKSLSQALETKTQFIKTAEQNYRDYNSTLENGMTLQRDQIGRLERANAEIRTTYEGQLTKLRAENRTLSDALVSNSKTLRDEVLSNKQRADEAEKAKSNAEEVASAKLTANQKQIDQLKEEVAKLKTEFSAAEKKSQKAEGELKTLQERSERTQTTLDANKKSLEETLKITKETEQKLKTEKDEALLNNKKLQDENETLKKENRKLTELLVQLGNDVNQMLLNIFAAIKDIFKTPGQDLTTQNLKEAEKIISKIKEHETYSVVDKVDEIIKPFSAKLVKEKAEEAQQRKAGVVVQNPPGYTLEGLKKDFGKWWYSRPKTVAMQNTAPNNEVQTSSDATLNNAQANTQDNETTEASSAAASVPPQNSDVSQTAPTQTLGM